MSRPVLLNPGNNGVAPFPERLLTSLDYYDNYQTTMVAAPVGQTMMLNDLHDPCRGAGWNFNLQPMGFDELAKFYRRYVVHGAKVHVHLHRNDNLGTVAPTMFSVRTQTNQTRNAMVVWNLAQYGASQVAPAWGVRMMQKDRSDVLYVLENGGYSVDVDYYKYFDMAGFFSVSKDEYMGSPQYWGATGTGSGSEDTTAGGPYAQCGLDIVHQYTLSNMAYDVSMWVTYYVEFFEPDQLTIGYS